MNNFKLKSSGRRILHFSKLCMTTTEPESLCLKTGIDWKLRARPIGKPHYLTASLTGPGRQQIFTGPLLHALYADCHKIKISSAWYAPRRICIIGPVPGCRRSSKKLAMSPSTRQWTCCTHQCFSGLYKRLNKQMFNLFASDRTNFMTATVTMHKMACRYSAIFLNT